MREVLLSVRHHGCPVSDTSAAHPNVHVQNLSKGQFADGRAKRLFCLRGDPDAITAYTTAFRSHPSVVRFDRVAGGDDSPIAYYSSEIAYDTTNPSILSRVHNKGCYQHSTVSIKRGWEHWKIYSEDTDTVHELVDELEALDNDVSLYRTTQLDTLSGPDGFDFSTFLTDLTPRQQAAFEAALSLGYYDADTDVTVDDVAADLDVHQSTAWEHLKKAENTILTTVGRQLFAQHDAQLDTITPVERAELVDS